MCICIRGSDSRLTRACDALAAERIASVEKHEDKRSSLVGNSVFLPVVAWCLSDFLAQVAVLPQRQNVSAVVACCWGHPEKREGDSAQILARALFSRQSYRGGELGVPAGPAGCKMHIPRAVGPHQWHWRPVVSSQWGACGEDIHALELRDYLLALFTRACPGEAAVGQSCRPRPRLAGGRRSCYQRHSSFTKSQTSRPQNGWSAVGRVGLAPCCIMALPLEARRRPTGIQQESGRTLMGTQQESYGKPI